ncbi:MAG: hypothetical protein Q9M11_03620 [Mariprofundaceae bacterium]|nr:hypothetical protein [Mariprofundaceae bacterium]
MNFYLPGGPMALNNNSIYTEEELGTLDKVKRTRIQLIDSMTADGVPDAVGQIRVLNEVLASTEKMIVDTANIRVKHDEASNSGAAVEVVVELLKQSRANQQQFIGAGTVPTLPAALASVDAVPGETEINPEPLTPEDFVAPTYDPSQVD